MGKSSRWFLSFIGVKPKPGKEKREESKDESKSTKPPRERRRWSFGRSSTRDLSVESTRRNSEQHSAGYEISDSLCFEKEQNKHAMAVAAASAAAAEAAVAAAHAAAAVVRLTSTGGGSFHAAALRVDEWAAVTIQAAFRGYLARRALRALRAVVRLQALFRGHLVRKQAAMTLQCMHALVRVQNRAAHSRRTLSGDNQQLRRQLVARPRKSVDGCPEGWDGSTTSLEDLHAKFDQRQLGALKREKARSYTHSQRRGTSERGEHPTLDCDSDTFSWLDRWMAAQAPGLEEARDCPEVATFDRSSEGSTKVVEMDSGRMKRRHRRRSGLSSESISYEPPPWSTTPPDYVMQYQHQQQQHQQQQQEIFARQAFEGKPKRNHLQDVIYSDEDQDGFESTAKSSPAFSTTGSKGRRNNTIHSHQSEDIYYDYSNADYPSYMAPTKSREAKTRSHSAPRQRPVSSSDKQKRNSLSGLELRPSSGSFRSTQRQVSPKRNKGVFTGPLSLDRSWMSAKDGQSWNGDFRRPFRP